MCLYITIFELIILKIELSEKTFYRTMKMFFDLLLYKKKIYIRKL